MEKSKTRIKVAIVAPDKLPIPNLKGGAIETLATHWLNKNEEYGFIEFYVFSQYCGRTEGIQKRYKLSQLYFYKTSFVHSLYNKIWGALYHFSKRRIIAKRSFILRIMHDIKSASPDIIIAEGSFLQVPQLKRLNIPIVLHLHTDILNDQEPSCKSIVDKCVQVWTNSDFVRTRVIEGGGQPTKVKTLPNAIDTASFESGEGDAIRKKYKIKPEQKVIIYCGRVDPIKGVKELILAFEKARIPNLVLMIVGGSRFADSPVSEYEKEIHSYVDSNRLNVVFTGFVTQSELHDYYHAADFFVCPSICNEAAGLVIVEARCAGLPVIATDIGGIREYVNPKGTILVKYSKNQFVENLALAIEKMYNEIQKSDEMHNNSKKGINKFDIDTYYINMVNYLEELL